MKEITNLNYEQLAQIFREAELMTELFAKNADDHVPNYAPNGCEPWTAASWCISELNERPNTTLTLVARPNNRVDFLEDTHDPIDDDCGTNKRYLLEYWIASLMMSRDQGNQERAITKKILTEMFGHKF